jgi:hypothetical protein
VIQLDKYGATNTLSVRVISQDAGSHIAYYDVEMPTDNNAKLTSLSISGSTLSPVFAGTTTSYTVSATVGSTPTVTWSTSPSRTQFPKWKWNAGGTYVTLNANQVLTAVAANAVLYLEFTAQDSSTKQTYQITFKSNNAKLASVSLPAGVTISPNFAQTTFAYKLGAPAGTTSLVLGAVSGWLFCSEHRW